MALNREHAGLGVAVTDVTTAVQRALLRQHGATFDGWTTNADGAAVELWKLSDRVQLAVSSAEAHFIVDGFDVLAPGGPGSVALALKTLQVLREEAPDVFGSNLQ